MIAASRNFICIRLATYEDAEEAKLLASIFRGRSGELENTVFALLSPDGQTPLIPSARGPKGQFATSSELAQSMNQISSKYRKPPRGAGLPSLKSVRLGLNVAACDGVPLIITYAPTTSLQRQLEAQLISVAWDPSVAGKACFAPSTESQTMKQLGVANPTAGYYLVAPDLFGTQGRVLATFPSGLTALELSQHLIAFRPFHVSPQSHLQKGHQEGIQWKTEVPITDPAAKY